MREIKFRAWNRRRKQMLIVASLDLGLSGHGFMGAKLSEPDGDGYLIQEVGNVTVELMQFTGLKDRNGKEIYEGDIVTNTPGEERHLFVRWDYDGYALFDRINGLEVREETIDDDIEVIGNIYENPELLTK